MRQESGVITYAQFRALSDPSASEEPTQGATSVSAPVVVDEPALGQRLQQVCSKAVNKLDEIMALPLERD
jgi:hypothetical protein